MSSRELGYFALHLYHILYCWSYQLSILFAYRILYCCFSPGTKAYLDHEYKIVSGGREAPYLQTLFRVFPRLRDLWLLTLPDGSSHSNDSSDSDLTLTKYSRLRAQRADTPSAAFHRIIHIMHLLHTSAHMNGFLDGEIQHFWYRGITGASKPDHYLFGGKWHIKDLPDPREELENDPLLCAIAASTAEQMVEIFNWRIGLGIRRDLRVLLTLITHRENFSRPAQFMQAFAAAMYDNRNKASYFSFVIILNICHLSTVLNKFICRTRRGI